MFINARKRKGFAFTSDLALAMLIGMIILFAVILGWPTIRDQANRYTANNELNTIKTAVTMYMGAAKSAAPPANLAALVTGLTAAQSIDHAAHKNLIDKKGWTTDSTFLDPWGNQYIYDASARTIKSSAGGGDEISVSF